MNSEKNPNTGASAEAIQHHYDVGNEFYRLWLDSTLTYSCALWEENDTLESAQIRKIDFHVKQARASGAERVLDVGCGWGATLKRLVEKHEVKQACGLTLSQTQAAWIASFNDPRIDVRVESWSDHSPEKPYDAIISIGAFEHFVKPKLTKAQRVKSYRAFFQRCHEWLKPGGFLSLQTIAYGNIRRENMIDFIEEIFPESELPMLAEIAEASERVFEIMALRNDRQHYKRTCAAWYSNLKANRAAAIKLVGQEMVARYEKYLRISRMSFHRERSVLLRITLRRIDHPAK